MDRINLETDVPRSQSERDIIKSKDVSNCFSNINFAFKYVLDNNFYFTINNQIKENILFQREMIFINFMWMNVWIYDIDVSITFSPSWEWDRCPWGSLACSLSPFWPSFGSCFPFGVRLWTPKGGGDESMPSGGSGLFVLLPYIINILFFTSYI